MTFPAFCCREFYNQKQKTDNLSYPLIIMVAPAGFEPATF